MIVLITGDFCVGKDVVADYFVENMDNAQKILSYTTREPRFEGEQTHLFCTKEEFEQFDDLVATTCINDEYYGARSEQFDKDKVNVYVVDNKGVSDVLNAHIDNVYVVEVVRPDWLKNCPKSRIDRNQVADRDFKVSYRIMNDGDLDKLFRICDDCLAFLQKCAA